MKVTVRRMSSAFKACRGWRAPDESNCGVELSTDMSIGPSTFREICFYLVLALQPPSRLPRRLHRGQQQADQNANDGYDHQQLDEREATRPRIDAHVPITFKKCPVQSIVVAKAKVNIASPSENAQRFASRSIRTPPEGG